MFLSTRTPISVSCLALFITLSTPTFSSTTQDLQEDASSPIVKTTAIQAASTESDQKETADPQISTKKPCYGALKPAAPLQRQRQFFESGDYGHLKH